MVAKIKELVKNPDSAEREREREREISDLKTEKEKLQTQLTEKNQTIADLQKPSAQIIEEVKAKIRKKAQEMKIYTTQLEKSLENAQSYQQLIDLEQKFLRKNYLKRRVLFDNLNGPNLI